MKFKTLPVKRRPVPKGILHRLSAVTRSGRKQRVAATAPAAEIEMDDGSSKISRALTIIFLIHIVAIGLIFIHQRFLAGRPTEAAVAPRTAAVTTPAATAREEELPRLSSGDKPYVVKPGDNYSRIATAENVDEAELRRVNKDVEIRPGLILAIPPQRIVAQEPPEVAAIRENTPPDTDRGLVEAVDVTDAPKARLVRPAAARSEPAVAANAAATPAAAGSGRTYVVRPGDSLWRIASRHKVSQDRLMQANGISDPRKLRAGMKLVIP